MFIGVADGTRTHDNRNHNPTHKSSINAGWRVIFWKKVKIWTRVFIGFPGRRSRKYVLNWKHILKAVANLTGS